MDWSYILFNTLVYGLIAFVLSTFFAYGKFLHLGVGAVMIFLGYAFVDIVQHDGGGFVWLWVIAIVIFYLLTIWITVHFFRQEKQRDLFGLIFTLGMSILIQNVINFIRGPASVNISGFDLPLRLLVILFVGINLLLRYFFGRSYFGKIMKGIFEKSESVRSLGVPVNRYLYVIFGLLLAALAIAVCLILIESNLRSSDSLFYLIKGIGIMILVGLSKKQYIFFGALLYVLIEYLMFIELGRPIMYKEALILVVILLVLILKPEGIFSLGERKL